jgi:hypothetical protein
MNKQEGRKKTLALWKELKENPQLLQYKTPKLDANKNKKALQGFK